MVQEPRVIAVVATYRRPRELARLLDCLERQGACVAGAVIADNAADPSLPEAARFDGRPFPVAYVPVPDNPGCGAGLRAAEAAALEQGGSQITHFLVLDDDAVLPDGCVELLLEGMRTAGAGLAAPMIREQDGGLVLAPEPLQRRVRRALRPALKSRTMEPPRIDPLFPILWCVGICVLVTRRAMEEAGLHRTDYWMLGEDMDFSIRVCARFSGVGLADLSVGHYKCDVPAGAAPAAAEAHRQHLIRFFAFLQNHFYMGFHVGASVCFWRVLPSNVIRFFRVFGLSGGTLRLAWLAFWNGVVRREPAGRPSGRRVMDDLRRQGGAPG